MADLFAKVARRFKARKDFPGSAGASEPQHDEGTASYDASEPQHAADIAPHDASEPEHDMSEAQYFAPSDQAVYTHEEIVDALYRGILGRKPDDTGHHNLIAFLQAGGALSNALEQLIASSELQSRVISQAMPAHGLPDLRTICPQHMHVAPTDHQELATIFRASADEDFQLLEDLMAKHRYYDLPGVWGAKIDLDKQVTAALVRGLGAKRCLELGCFSGAVISLLERTGIEVTGLDLSHLAFVLAYSNVRDRIVYGDLLSTSFGNKKFDVILAMDILEHLNPLKLDTYIRRIDELLEANGYLYINSPMFGADDIFGTVFPAYMEEWHQIGDASFWRDLDCDTQGWPKHGHLVWASPRWWEEKFSNCGFVRDREIERSIHLALGKFFEMASSRRCLFVLKRADSTRSSLEAIQGINQELDALDIPR